MKSILSSSNISIIRLDKGDEFIKVLTELATKNNISAAYFTALGACQKVTLSYYDLEKKEYDDQVFEKDMEIASLMGNIATIDRKIVIHAHGVFGDKSLKAYAGHIKKLTVSATCEIYLQILDGSIQRAYDADTGLNLMQ